MQIGVRAHDFGVLPPDLLAEEIYPSGAVCIQLALAKALRDVPVNPKLLGASGAQSIRDSFKRRGIGIAVLGCYINPVHPDPEAREAALSRFEDHLRLAGDFGCTIVGTETGSVAPDCSFHPETSSEANFKALVASISRLAEFAERLGPGAPYIGVEAVADTHTIASAALMRRLLDEVASPAVGVIFDPTNLVPRAGIASQAAFLDDCFAAFGQRIVAVHAKDYLMLPEAGSRFVKSEALPAGQGETDWLGLFRRLESVGRAEVPILLENAGPVEAPAAINHLRALWEAARLKP